ncbi:hypothetical protein [Streptomyces sp. NPDC088182]|uniref:hypothetical protein n=1 Tax=Streptomyces sp. NPDC088182 TaxID=3365838 RepID=UPI003804BC9D
MNALSLFRRSGETAAMRAGGRRGTGDPGVTTVAPLPQPAAQSLTELPTEEADLSTYTEYSVTVTRRVFEVPAPKPWGASSAEMSSAWDAAAQSYRDVYGLPADARLPNDALSFHPSGSAIFIFFTVEGSA